jgi:hypothetical protein
LVIADCAFIPQEENKVISQSYFRRSFMVHVLVLACVLLNACTSFIPTPEPTKIPTPYPTCIPYDAIGSNPYTSYAQLVARNTELYVQNQPTTKESGIFREYYYGTISLDGAQQKAFLQLVYHTEHLSDAEDFAVNDRPMIRVTITYLSPELVGFIFLNQVFYSIRRFGLAMSPEEFDAELQKQLMTLGDRSETLFMATVTAASYAPEASGEKVMNVRIPFKSMKLNGTSDIHASPNHFDRVLSEKIPITRGPVSGYIGYPISVQVTSCNLVVDPKWTTSLTLSITNVKLGDTDFEEPSWSIFYDPLMEDGDSANKLSQTMTDMEFQQSDLSQISPTPEPPFVKPSSADVPYWETMAKYVWYWVWMEHHY